MLVSIIFSLSACVDDQGRPSWYAKPVHVFPHLIATAAFLSFFLVYSVSEYTVSYLCESLLDRKVQLTLTQANKKIPSYAYLHSHYQIRPWIKRKQGNAQRSHCANCKLRISHQQQMLLQKLLHEVADPTRVKTTSPGFKKRER